MNATSLIELRMATDLFERWQDDPAWPGIRDSLKNPTDFPHAVATLGAASLLIDAGNSVGLNVVLGSRAPDLRLQMNATEYVGGEVKAPTDLLPAAKRVDTATARRLVKKALRSARTGAGGQLAPDRTGFLVIAGFHRGERDLGTLEAAARQVLSNKARPHVLAIVMVGLGVLLDERPDTATLGGTMSLRIAANPHHSGDITLNTDPRSGLRPIPDAQEMTWPARRA